MDAADNPPDRPLPGNEAEQAAADLQVFNKMLAIWGELRTQAVEFSRIVVIPRDRFDTWTLVERAQLQEIML